MAIRKIFIRWINFMMQKWGDYFIYKNRIYKWLKIVDKMDITIYDKLILIIDFQFISEEWNNLTQNFYKNI